VDDRGLTRREYLRLITANSPCNSCHQFIDPLGASLEHFDAFGEYRDVDNGKPVDSSGIFPDASSSLGPFPFASFDDLAPKFGSSCEVARCFAAAMFSDALNAGPLIEFGTVSPYSGDELDYVANRFADANFSLRELVKAIVESPTFLR